MLKNDRKIFFNLLFSIICDIIILSFEMRLIMEITATYILAQICTIITYLFLALTYFPKKRSTIMLFAILSTIFNAIVYFFLNAYSGLAMCGVALLKNIIFLIDAKEENNKITKKDVFILIFLYCITIIFAIFTYEVFFSLLSVFANSIYLYACWQKSPTIYKILGIPTEICWILYNIYIQSLLLSALETIVFICTIIGYLLEIKKGRCKMNKTDETIETYDNIVSEYIKYFNSKNLKGNVQFQKEIDILVENLQENSKILDVGTAIGDYPKYLTEKCNKNFEVIGIDSSKNMINVAIKNAPKAKFKVMDMRNMEFPSNSFDAILCLATLIHVNDMETIKILEKFDLLLKEKGILIINVMEHLNGEKEIYEKEPFNPKYNTYFNQYKKDFFIKWFSDKNYEVLNIIDNPIFNPEEVKELSADTNQFSIIVKK